MGTRMHPASARVHCLGSRSSYVGLARPRFRGARRMRAKFGRSYSPWSVEERMTSRTIPGVLVLTALHMGLVPRVALAYAGAVLSERSGPTPLIAGATTGAARTTPDTSVDGRRLRDTAVITTSDAPDKRNHWLR